MSAAFDIALDMLRQVAQDAAEWRTSANGKHFEVDTESGEITKGNVGQGEWDSPAMQEVRRNKIEDAMREIANGAEEATISGLRNDLEQYGGSNDVTIIKGNAKKGLEHIEERHGQNVIPFVLEAVANGKITRFSRGNKTVALQKDGYEAILSLEEHGKRKTWLLTGYRLLDDGNMQGSSDGHGKFCPRHAPTHAGPTSSRPGMGAEAAFRQRILDMIENVKATALDRALVPLAFDRASARTTDENGFMHVAASHITKATVNPYHGREIPGWQEAGLDPDRVYHGLRDPEELRKSIPTWRGLPLHIEHHIDSADDPQKLTRVGTVGTDVVWNAPYIDAPLTVWDKTAIDSIKDGSFRELSCAYRYDPDFVAGEYEGQPYDFIMRNIRGNHVALVEEGRAGRDVLVADAALKGQDMKYSNLEKVAMALKNWFRGAKDSDPTVERKEVDLAQAILDLHKVDPLTGEVKDITEDDDRVAELKILVEGLKDKLPPEDLKKLTDVVAALAVAQAEDNAEENAGLDSDAMGAMKKAGCDADDPDEAKAFAEGVKYGEELEKNPAERARLDREHESEGMKKAMDACGVDAENPAETKAFAEGVKYGEEKERAEREKLDKEHESEGMKAAEDEDKDAMIEKIIAAVPGLSEEQIKKMRDTLADLAYSPATGDEDIDEKVEAATDSALKKRRFLGATDAARIKAQATADAMARMRSLNEAVRRVRPLVGEMDPLAFDSANNVYGYALQQMGIDARKYDKRAWRGMVDMLLRQPTSTRSGNAVFAKDSKIPTSGPFAHLSNITLG